jgi:hypothetical protein
VKLPSDIVLPKTRFILEVGLVVYVVFGLQECGGRGLMEGLGERCEVLSLYCWYVD